MNPPLDDPTPCYGRHQLFDSRDPADHHEAKQLCATCPQVIACLRNLHDVQTAVKAEGGSPEGTWAGQLMGGAKHKAGRPKKLAECGTEAGYQRHHHYGDPIDQACREAHREHAREAARRRAREAS